MIRQNMGVHREKCSRSRRPWSALRESESCRSTKSEQQSQRSAKSSVQFEMRLTKRDPLASDPQKSTKEGKNERKVGGSLSLNLPLQKRDPLGSHPEDNITKNQTPTSNCYFKRLSPNPPFISIGAQQTGLCPQKNCAVITAHAIHIFVSVPHNKQGRLSMRKKCFHRWPRLVPESTCFDSVSVPFIEKCLNQGSQQPLKVTRSEQMQCSRHPPPLKRLHSRHGHGDMCSKPVTDECASPLPATQNSMNDETLSY